MLRVFSIHCGALGCALAAGCGQPESSADCSPEPGHVCTIAGTGELGFNRDGLAATDSDLYLPSAARRGPDGSIYVVDFNNQRLRVIDEDGTMRTAIGDGFHALAAVGENVTDSPLENPIDFDFLSDGRLVFVSYHDPRVLLRDDDDTLQSLAGTGEVGVAGDEGDAGPAQEAQFMQLDGIAIDAHDTIYVADSLAHRVRMIRDGRVDTIAGSGSRGYSGDGGPAVAARLNWPTALTFDPQGRLLIADAQNHVVRRVERDGSIVTVAGSGAQGDDGDGGPALEAEFNQPNGLCYGPDGSLYISDRGNFRVRVVRPDGTVHTVAGTGKNGNRGHGVPALEADFSYLARVAIDGDAVLVADQNNSIVRRVWLP